MNKVTVKRGDCFNCPDDGECKFLASECPMPMPEITIKQVVEWLEGKRALFAKEVLTDDVIIIDAILAALAEKAEPVTEEMKELSEVFDYLVYRAGKNMTWDYKIQKFIDQIRDLIVGNQGGAVTEEERIYLEVHFNEVLRGIYHLPDCKGCTKIRALIVGKGAGE